jgi:acetylglutamate kinase
VLLDGEVVAEMDRVSVEAAIDSGAISGGMVPKVRAALAALDAVRAVRITDLGGLDRAGTRFVAGKDQEHG